MIPATKRIAGVVLAGGGSTRMGRPKAALAWEGGTFVSSIARKLDAAGLAPIVVVCGVHAPETRAALPADVAVTLLENPAPERGQLSSLKIALDALGGEHAAVDAALVALVDHPAVRPGTIARLRDAATRDRIALPTHGGRRGHPVVFGRALFGEILATPDEAGARAVVRRDPARIDEIAADDPGVLADVDTPADLARLRGG